MFVVLNRNAAKIYKQNIDKWKSNWGKDLCSFFCFFFGISRVYAAKREKTALITDI